MARYRTLELEEIVGANFQELWEADERYIVCYGGRGGGKSTDVATDIILKMLSDPELNVLVARYDGTDLLNSCYSQLEQALYKIFGNKPERFWTLYKYPLKFQYNPTGQVILFKGLNDPQKVKSITVSHGRLKLLWIEEAYEIADEEAFNMLDLSMRGSDDIQIILTFNNGDENHWLKKRFIDEENEFLTKDYKLIHHSYLDNRFLTEADLNVFEAWKKRDYRGYEIHCLGNRWGSVGKLVFDNFSIKQFDAERMKKEATIEIVGGIYRQEKLKYIEKHGMDFGFTNDPTAFISLLVDTTNRELYIYDELYSTGLTNMMIGEKLNAKGYYKEHIRADSSEPKSIEELRKYLPNMEHSRKGADSISFGIQLLKQFKIYISPNCKNTINEFNNYTWVVDKMGIATDRPIDSSNHAMDALRYAMEDIHLSSGLSWENY